MIDEAQGRSDHDECGSGPALVLPPGSCSTGAAWRPKIAAGATSFAALPPLYPVMVEPASGAPQAIPPTHAAPKQWTRLEEMSVPGQRRNTRREQMFSALPPTTDIA